MKIIRDTPTEKSDRGDPARQTRYCWKILIVDDEPDVRTLTRLSLRDFVFGERSLEFLEASSAMEALDVLRQHSDVAVALIDVVMETDNAGLQLVETIRRQLGNQMLRIVIRTGQPGIAPERYVIDHYDIDDYKDKTELTAPHLYTTVRSALKAYRDLQAIDTNRYGLETILKAAPSIYRFGRAPLSDFFQGVLAQIIGLCGLSRSSHLGSFEGFITTVDHGEIKVQASTDHFADNPRFPEIYAECLQVIQEKAVPEHLRQRAEILPLVVENVPVGYVYVEPIEGLSEDDRKLIRIFTHQCSQALENFELHSNIVNSFESAVDMLAEIAEYKDKATGGHVNRLDYYTRTIARAMDVSEEEAVQYGRASRLHDVGKVGIPDHILAKPGKLTPEEFEIIKTHSRLGANILSHDPAFSLAREVALHHHERWDGKGYPEGIPSRELPLVTRIVSVADAFDAMISFRPYKNPWTVQAACTAIREASGVQFDPEVAEAFLRVVDGGLLDDVIRQAAAALPAPLV